jgi:hypothetical protein
MNLISVHQSYRDNPPERIINTLLVCRPISLRFIGLMRAHITHGMQTPQAQAQQGPEPVTSHSLRCDSFAPATL